ncbi:polymorphic toxin-type HINT domain-containing protein [Lentzea sp. CA-135723]|uniref:polymorphic toxin-type HINT domain-containing protein n=1 Tax=Lentzea sp. CA-135723 TaxID=3239950 RepID=UPI003D8EDFFA
MNGLRELAEARALAPKQQWGTADGQSHEVSDGFPNQEAPASLQSKYPRIEAQNAGAPRNEAEVKPASATVRGFDAATSKELADERGERERTYRNSDGTLTTEFSQSAVNYRKPDGTWAPIDTTFVGTSEGWRNAADQTDLRLSRDAGATSMVRLKFDDQHEVSFGLQGTTASTGVANGNSVTYPKVLPGVDLKFEAQAGGVKEVLVLESADAPHSWTFPLQLKGLTAKVVDEQVVLSDRDGKERGRFPRGFMTDSNVDPRTGDPAISYGVKYRIDGQNLIVEADSAWLRDPVRKYPVLVDPTIENRGTSDARFYQGTWNTYGGSELKVGNSGGLNSAGYLGFAGVENTLRNHKIHGAALSLTNYWSWSCSPRPVSVHPVLAPWGGGGYPGPSVGAALTESSFAHGYIGPGQTRSNCPTAAEQVNLGAAGRDLIQRWVTGEQANHGLSIRASESDNFGWKKFTGRDTANPPRLYITHTPYDAEYRIDRGVPEPPVHAQSHGFVKLTVTNRGAETWTPDTYALGYRAFTEQGNPVRTAETALPRNVQRGESVTVDVKIDPLGPGGYLFDFSMLRKGGPWFTDEQIPPARLAFRVYNIQPVVKAQYPPNGYSSPTLTPQLWTDAVDIDSPPGKALQYRFKVCEFSNGEVTNNCFESDRIDTRMWTVPAGKLFWGKDYVWQSFAYDGDLENPALPWSHLLTSVPQPSITTHLANAPYNGANKAFDPQNGNYFSSAIDVSLSGSGPELSVARTYNSLDPRRDLAFGAGWSTRWDMRVVPDNDGSGNVVVTYPDGQQVRFGRNPGGGFAPAPGRQADLHAEPAEFGGGWIMVDTRSTSYRFAQDGKLTKITDQTGQVVDVKYDQTTGRLSEVVNPRNARKLTFTWVDAQPGFSAHVRSVRADADNDQQLTWNYEYTGDKLTKVCDPKSGCTQYQYDQGSHYRSAVIDANPGSYWRLGDPAGTKVESQVRTNLGKDDGVANDTTWAPGAIAGSPDGARQFNGTSSFVKLPAGLIKKNRDLAVEMWFKTTSGGPLLGMQHYEFKQDATPSTPQMPVLWVGTDGKLRGNFWNGKAEPITTTGTVNNDQWHHVVLSGSVGTQSLFLDGELVNTALGEIDHLTMTNNQLGAANTDGWPGLPGGMRYFSGTIDEVSFYEHAIGTTTAKQHFGMAKPSDQLTKITLPSGRVAATMAYDVVNDRLREYTDSDGGLWKIAAPAVTGTEQNLVRTTMVTDPGNRFHYADYDPSRGRILRSLTPLGQGVRPEDMAIGGPVPPGGDPWGGGPNRGAGVRSFDYDDRGFMNKITDENGNQVQLTNDTRGNAISRKTCRTSTTDCQTSYFSYYNNPSDLTDPRNGKLLTSADGRSAHADDTTYRTTNTYTGVGVRGLFESQRLPDGSMVRHTYTTSSSVGPAGLVETTTDARNVQTKYTYYQSGDLESVKNAAGLVTRFTYDKLGRKITQTEVSTAYPQGQTTTFTYDELSRQKTITRPATTNKITGVKHTQRTTYEYDADGNVIEAKVSDLTGGDQTRQVTTEYDGRGRAARVTDPEGNVTTSGYDSFGNLAWTVDAVGTKYEYAYTSRNKIAEVRLRAWHGDPVGPGGPGGDGDGDQTVLDTLVLKSYAYDVAGRLTRETDAMGRSKRYEYYKDDTVRRVIASKIKDPFDSSGATRDLVLQEFTYDKAGNVAKVVNAGGLVVEKTYDVLNRVKTEKADPAGLGRTTSYDYDAGGNVTKVAITGKPSNSVHQDAPRTFAVEYGYDTAGRRTSETSFNGTERLTTSSVFDQRGLLSSATDPRGTAAGADAAAFTTNYTYDEGGRLVAVTSPTVQVETNGVAVSARPTVQTGLDTFGGGTELKDANGNVSKQAFDKLGRVVRAESPDYTKPGTTTAARAVTLTEYTPLGDVRKVTNPRGAVTEFSYDQQRRLVARYQADAATAGRTTGSWLYSYTRSGEQLSVTDPTGARVETTYDDLGRAVTSTQLERFPTPSAFTTRMTYDDASNLKTVTSPLEEVSTYAYDAVGQRTSSTDPAGVVTKLGYDSIGRQSRVSDGLNRTTFQTYDTAGRPSTQYSLDANESLLRMSRNSYDRAGNLVQTTDPYQRATTFTYDAMRRVTSQVEPVADNKSITTSFGYDAAGNRTRFTDGRGNKTLYTVNSLGLGESTVEPSTTVHPQAADRTWTVGYDLNGNPDKVTAPGGVTRTRTYDLLDRLTGETGTGAEESTDARTLRYDLAGLMVESNAPGGTNVLTYNDRGALLTTDGPSGKSSFTYDSNGRMATRTDESGTSRYSYLQGRAATTQDSVTGAVQTLGYNEAGQVKIVSYGADRTRSFGYDEYGRLKTDKLAGAGGTTAASIDYGYDLADRLTSKTTAGLAGSGTNTYEYDYSNRLTGWTFNGTRTDYGWDDAGNRVRAGAKTATYDERNRLQGDGDYTYKWSARGTLAARVSSGLEEKYGFDSFDRAVRNGETRFAYDGLDRLSARNGKKFTYAGNSLDLVSDGESRFSRGADGSLQALAQGDQQRLTVSDRHGDLVGGFDPAGSLQSLTDSAAFDPFGQAMASAGAKRSLGFQGDYTDPASGEVDMGARWYSPGTGGFTARDSISLPSSPSGLANRYAYGLGAPTNYDDPDGHCPICLGVVAVVGLIGWGAYEVQQYMGRPVPADPQPWCSSGGCGPTYWTDGGGSSSDSFGGGNIPGRTISPGKNNTGGVGVYRPGPSPTQVARDASVSAARNNPLPQVAAATTPIFSGSAGDSIAPPVSSSPDAPAQQVSDNQVADQQESIKRDVDKVTGGEPVIKSVGEPKDVGFWEWVENKVSNLDWSEVGHTILDVVGMIPVVGEIADGINAVWYLAEGDYVNAALSAAALVPFAGAAATAGKLIGKGLQKYGDEVASAVGCLRGRNSFVAGTRVLMADGSTKPIEQVQVGDEVVATDPTTGETSSRKVTDLIVGTGAKELVKVTVDTDGEAGDRTDSLTATGGHPFWVEDRKTWRDAKGLEPGDDLRTADGALVEVTGIAKWTEHRTVYNLTVDGLHTYYVLVGNASVLVHNYGAGGGTPCGAFQAMQRATELQKQAGWSGTTSVVRVRSLTGLVDDAGKALEQTWVASNKKYMPTGWRKNDSLGADEIFQKGDGHAEETIINNLFNKETGVQEWGIVEGGTSTGICWSNCYPDLTGNGITVGGPGFRSSKMNSPWRMFWSM